MGVITTYDEKRNHLREQLEECLRLAKELVVTDCWGSEDVREDYSIEVFQAVKKAKDAV